MKNNRYLFLLLIILLLGIAITYGLVHYHELSFGGKIELITLGNTQPEQVALIKKEIENFYGFSVSVIPEHALPKEAYYQPRNRYKANVLVRYLAEIKPAEDDKLIALVQKDISVKMNKHEDWGVMGLASIGGPCCVVSPLRLRRDRPTKERFNERLTKVVLHELGHTLGLKHCVYSVYCLMKDANGSVRTIDKEKKELCKQCTQQISYTKL